MIKKITGFVSFPLHSRRFMRVMKLTAILLLTGYGQLMAASYTPDGLFESIISDDQQRSVTGRIVDNTGQTLPGVNIVEKGTVNGAVSDVDGRFSINVASASSVLVFSFVGYTTQEVTVGTQSTISITLEESAVGLDEIVVVGYGTQQKRAISGSVTSVAEKDFNAGISRTAADFIQGKVAGLTITTSTGDVTAQQSIRLRGTSSLTGSSEPFVVIDGVPGLGLNSVAPQDIESISVLKDASAAAIYGSRSANGVILITTKKEPRTEQRLIIMFMVLSTS
jgi:iron complex outermembrane receptor protein